MIGIFFICWRVVEILFLIPIIGMMAYFVNGFLNAGILTPDYILILFIVSVIAVFWAFDTMIRHSTTKRSAAFVSLVDFGFFGAFVAGVVKLGFISNANCSSWSNDSYYINLGPFGVQYQQFDINQTCSMLKTCFAFGIMEVIFFFITAISAIFIYRNQGVIVKETVVRRRSHSSRRGHSHHGSRRGSSSRRSGYVV